MDFVISYPLAHGAYVMLTEQADPELTLTLGSESVMQIVTQSGVDISTNADGDLTGIRKYAVQHLHRGRLYLNIPETALRVISKEEAQGQRLLHNEMTRDLVEQIRAASDP